MSIFVNKVTILGNVGKDPEIRSHNDSFFANFSVATSETYKDQHQQNQTLVEWHNISVSNKHIVEVVRQFVHKGSKVYIEGKIKSNKYKDRTTGLEIVTKNIVISAFDGKLIVLNKIEPEEEMHSNTSAQQQQYQGKNSLPLKTHQISPNSSPHTHKYNSVSNKQTHPAQDFVPEYYEEIPF